MSKWEKVAIPDVLFFQEGPGVRNTQYTTTGVKLLNVANLQDGKVDLSTSNRYISEEEAYGKYKHFLVDADDFIIASSGIQVDYFEKKMGFVSSEQLPLCMNTSTIRFKSLNKDKLNIKYFMYYLKTQEFKTQLSKFITGSAQLNFGPSHIKQMNIPLPPLAIQNQIVKILDHINSLFDKRKLQIVKLDMLVKSRFVEMFGDPVTNPKGWESKRLDEITSTRLGKMLDTKKQTGVDIYPYLANFNVQWFKFDLLKLNKMDFNEADRKEFALEYGDLLICEGGEVGRTAIWKNELSNCFFQKAIHRVRCNYDICIPEYLAWVMYYKAKLTHFDGIVTGITISHLTGEKLKSLKILLPPISLQTQFAEFVQQVDKSKFALQKGLEKLELCYKSLMQQYFG
jgi:type I restriction enzyme S subunit